jgi:hypothetical protein
VKKIFLFKVFQSRYCVFVYLLGLILGYFLVPKKIFTGMYSVLGVLYILIFAIVLMCIVRTIKERIFNVKNTGASAISVIASLFGLGALQVCGFGAPVCGATIGVGILSILFPQSSFLVFEKYAVYIVAFSLILQLISIYYMGCLKKCLSKAE